MKRIIFATLLALSGCAEYAGNLGALGSVHWDPGAFTRSGPSWNGLSEALHNPAAIAESEKVHQRFYDQKLLWMRRNYVPGHTVISERGDMITTIDGVQHIEWNPWRDSTVVEPGFNPEAE
jgi:hypothetical protein